MATFGSPCNAIASRGGKLYGIQPARAVLTFSEQQLDRGTCTDLTFELNRAAQHLYLGLDHEQSQPLALNMVVETLVKTKYLLPPGTEVDAHAVVPKGDLYFVLPVARGDGDAGCEGCLAVLDAVDDQVVEDAVKVALKAYKLSHRREVGGDGHIFLADNVDDALPYTIDQPVEAD